MSEAPTAVNSPALPRSVASVQPKGALRRFVDQVVWLAVDQWFLIGIGVLILIASQVQVPQSQQQTKTTVINYLCPTIIFVITGCTLPTKTLINAFTQIRIHLFVQGLSFLLCSSTVFGLVSALASNKSFMDPALLVGLIFMACAPTTISSNVVMTRQAHGNAALTVAESALGNVLAPFITPLLVRMYLASGAGYTHVVPSATSAFGPLYRRVFKQLGLNMLLPLFVGQLIQAALPKLCKKVLGDWKLSKLSSVALLMIIWSTYDSAFRTAAITSVKGTNVILIVFMSMGLYGAWLVLALFLSRLWLNKRDTIAVCYCVPAKTPAMGVPLASAMFAGLDSQTAAKIQVPLVIFQGLQIAAGSIGTIPFRRWARDEEEAEKRQQQEDAKAAAGDTASVEKAPVGGDEKRGAEQQA